MPLKLPGVFVREFTEIVSPIPYARSIPTELQSIVVVRCLFPADVEILYLAPVEIFVWGFEVSGNVACAMEFWRLVSV